MVLGASYYTKIAISQIYRDEKSLETTGFSPETLENFGDITNGLGNFFWVEAILGQGIPSIVTKIIIYP